MATYNKFNVFSEDVGKGVHNFGTHTLKIALTNTAPVATQTVLDTVTNHPPPAAANGYTAGGTALPTLTYTRAAGVSSLKADKVVFTATAGGIGPFRYAILYNDTASGDPLIAWYDRGSPLTLANTETFEVRFDSQETAGKVLDLS